MTIAGDRIQLSSREGRLLLLTVILASGMAFLDGTVVNVALPHIEEDLGGGFSTLQWVLDAYLLTLGSLVLVGGALGDLLGRTRVFRWGVVGFLLASVACGLAPNAATLVGARAFQGLAAALLVPGSLALLSANFTEQDRGRAIGAWSGLVGIVTALGPFVGGALVDAAASGWRWVFLINAPLAVVVVLLLRTAPKDPGSRSVGPLTGQVDLLGAALTIVGLALVVGPLIEIGHLGSVWASALCATGLAVLGIFVWWEHRREVLGSPEPMLPPSLWRFRSFTVANAVTFVIYGALGALMLLITIGLQFGLGWSALATGAATVPISLILVLGSSRVGAQLPRLGARLLIAPGCALMAVGSLILMGLGTGSSYWTLVLPGVVVFGSGLVLVVAPITTTALGDIPVSASGVGSGVNNAVARVASLIAIAVVPLIAGLATVDPTQGTAVLPGFRIGMLTVAIGCAIASLIASVGFRASSGRGQATEV